MADVARNISNLLPHDEHLQVTRTKNKWKTTLKDGVMRLGGRDYVFHKGLGEFDW